MTDHLHHDFETRSEVMIDEVGLYNYLTHPSTEVLMMAWAMNDSAVRLWEPHLNPQMPAELQEALEDPFVEKMAWNAPFEKGVHRHVLNLDIPAEEWSDPSINARYISLPGSLDDAGEVLQIGEEVAKKPEGKELIKLFCEPVQVGGGSGLFGRIPTTWNDWKTHPDKWERFGGYCRQDVVAERFILKKILRWAPPASERRAWELDQRINERGMPADMALVAGATRVVAIERARLERRLLELTGLPNPNSVPQLMPWVRERGYIFNAMGKAFVKRALAGEGELTSECREALLLRLQTSKSSVHKLDALRMNAAADGRLRHQFVFMGAGATGRWCLAEGTLITVRRYGVIKEVAIEDIWMSDQLWDGEQWVDHDGVVFSGDKDVITWDGITATAEHEVWISSEQKLTLGDAKEQNVSIWRGDVPSL